MLQHTHRLRNNPRISYHELKEPSFDEYVYCEKCCDYVYEYCSVHGPLLVIPDAKVPTRSHAPSSTSLAALSIPHVFLHLAPSIIPGAGLGVFATLTLPQGVRFGPYRGQRTQEVNSVYCWQIYDANKRPSHVIDGSDIAHLNWMRYVNCARHSREQNLIAYQYRGDVYYRTIKIVPRCSELLVFYGSEYADFLNVDLQKYNSKNVEAIGYNPSSANRKNKTKEFEIENSKNTNCKEYVNFNDEKSEVFDIAIEDDFRSIDDTSEINTEDNRRYEENQFKVGVDIENQYFNIEFYKNDRSEFRYNTGTSNDQVMHIDFNSEHCQPLIEKDYLQIDSENQIYFTNIITNGKEIQADLKSEDFKSFIAENNQLHTATSKSTNQHVDNFDRTAINNINNKTTNKDNNNNFTKIITDGVAWQCNDCHKILTSKSSLRKHAKIHGDKIFNCTECSYNTNFKCRLDIHMVIHTGIYKFKCELCSFATNSGNNLRKHCLRMHGSVDYNCEFCSYKVPRKFIMKHHRNLHGKINVLKCDLCDYLCIKNRYLKRHVLATHNKI